MAKIHITLVGGQPAPVYNGIVATNPDKVVYIYSQGSSRAVETLRKEIDLPEDEQKPLDTTNPQIIMERVNTLKAKYANDEITLNISSGLKSWSHLFGREFEKMPNASVVYMDQNNVLWNYKTMQGCSDFNFDMFTLFRLYGNPIDDHYTNFYDYTEADKECCQKIEQIRKGGFHTEFTNMLSLLNKTDQNVLKNQPSGTFESKRGTTSFVSWEKPTEGENGFVRIYLQGKKRNEEIVLKSPHAIDLAFNSGWFEYKVARLLSHWKKAKNIYMNCRFPFKSNVDKNEVDIIVNAGNKLLFVECKTQINKTTDIDKFNSVVRAYGGTASKALFVTDAIMTDVAKKKCEEYGIMTFSLQESHFLETEKALFLTIDNELFNINTK